MIHQFAELGLYYREREGIGASSGDQLALYSYDPAQKFRTDRVLLLVFTDKGFERAQVEQYDDSKRLQYLYRSGPPNGWDATPTSKLQQIKEKTETEFDKAFTDRVRKTLTRLGRSVADSVQNNADLPGDEKTNLEKMRDSLLSSSEDSGLIQLERITKEIRTLLPSESKKNTIVSSDAIISVAWKTKKGDIKRVGDFLAFRQALVRQGLQSASSNKGIGGEAKGIGQCSICGKSDVEVYGKLQVPNFKLYTLDKPGSISGGFAPLNAWRNFPACRECCVSVDFAGERVKKNLSFDYYGYKYLFLPSPVQPAPTAIYEFLDRLTDARINRSVQKRLTAAEDEILYVLAQKKTYSR